MRAMRPLPKQSERWLGRSKHVYVRVLGDERAIVGRSITLGVDLEAAVPTNLEGGPSLARSRTSLLLVQLFRKVNGRELMLYRKEYEVPISTRALELASIPLTVADRKSVV